MTALPNDDELSFGRLRALADVLRLSSSTSAALRPFAVELFRTQTEFNHRLVDVLEDAVWTRGRIEQRLGPRVNAASQVVNARGGIRGQLVVWTKRAGLAGLKLALGQALRAMEQTNRAYLSILEGSPFIPRAVEGRASRVSSFLKAIATKRWLGLEAWFEAQATFYEAVEQFRADMGDALTDFSAALARFPEAPASAEPGPQVTVQVVTDDALLNPQADVVFRVPAGEALADGAVDHVAAIFAAQPELQLCYGDTFFDDTKLAALKPGWSPEYLLSTNYIGGCYAMRTALAIRLGLDATAPLRWLLESEPDENQVARIPRVLSHRPAPDSSGATRERALVSAHPGGARLSPNGSPKVTIVVPFKDKAPLLRGLWESMQRFDPGLPFELLLVSNQSEQPETFAFLRELNDPRVSWFAWDEPFNWSKINNAAAKRATGELLLFLNNDIELTHAGWLRDLAGYALHPKIGVAGARLLYPDGSIQHAGVVIGLRALAGHVFARWRPEYGPTPFGMPDATRNWSAVTGACLMIRRALFEELGGFDEGIRISGGDIELCLRVRARELRVVCVGHVVLTHFESVTRRNDGVPEEDLRRERLAYAALLERGDPYYHPRLSTEVGHGGPGPVSARQQK